MIRPPPDDLREALRAMLDEMLARTGGRLTRDEARAADRVLYGPRGRRRARR